MSCPALHPGHAGALGVRQLSSGAARAPFTASPLVCESKRHAVKPCRAEKPLQHAACLVGTSLAAVSAQRPWQQCNTAASNAAAAVPAAAAERDTVSTAEVSPSGSVGITADEPVPSAEPSSVSLDPQQAAADAEEQAQQTAAYAASAAGATAAAAAADSNGAAAPAEAAAAVPAAGAEAAKPQRRQNDRAWVPRGQHRLQRREQLDRQQTGPVEPIPKEDVWIRAGDLVACKVEWANGRGARVSTLRDPRIIGYMPAKEGPYYIRGEGEMHDIPPHEQATGDWGQPILPVGLVREFQVLKVPADIEYNGRGPLLSARLVDLDMLWARGEQALRACREGKEMMQVKFQELNEGGLMARFLGLRLFMPLSHLARPEPGKFMTHEELNERYIEGGPTQVGITEVDAFNRRFVCSEQAGLENNVLRQLDVGSLVWGTVRRVQDFGAFVGFDDTRASGLIHISNISRQHVGYTDEVFQVGDRVRSVVLSQEDYSRFSLSTAELEEQPGDMLRDKEKVYEGAEEQVKVFLELQAEAAAEDDAYSATDGPRDSQILASGHY